MKFAACFQCDNENAKKKNLRRSSNAIDIFQDSSKLERILEDIDRIGRSSKILFFGVLVVTLEAGSKFHVFKFS